MCVRVRVRMLPEVEQVLLKRFDGLEFVVVYTKPYDVWEWLCGHTVV